MLVAMRAEGKALSRIGWRGWAPLAVMALAHAPLVAIHFRHLWHNGLHAHFPFVLAAVGALIWARWEGPASIGRWRKISSAILLACGFLVLLLAVLIWSPWVGYIASLLTSCAVLLRICPAPVRRWGAPWLLLWLLVPFPMGLDRQLSMELQSYSSRAASLLLDFFRVNHVRTGNVIEVPNLKFSVVEACSGIHSLYVLVAASAILAVWLRHRLVHALFLIAASACWAAATNMMRVAGVVIAGSRWGLDIGTGWRHDVWGLVLFGIAMLLVLSTDQVFWMLFSPSEEPVDADDQDPDEEVSDADEPDQPAKHFGFANSWIIAGMFACLGVIQAVPRSDAGSRTLAPISVDLLSAQTLPDQIGSWQKVGFETEKRGAGNIEGENSAIWRYQAGKNEAVVSFDFPFSGWHQVTLCYRGRGCQVLDWKIGSMSGLPEGSPSAVSFAAATLEFEDGKKGRLLFAEWDSSGMLTPPATEAPSIPRIQTDLKNRLREFAQPESADRTVYQLQVLSVGSDETDESLEKLLVESLRVLKETTEKK